MDGLRLHRDAAIDESHDAPGNRQASLLKTFLPESNYANSDSESEIGDSGRSGDCENPHQEKRGKTCN